MIPSLHLCALLCPLPPCTAPPCISKEAKKNRGGTCTHSSHVCTSASKGADTCSAQADAGSARLCRKGSKQECKCAGVVSRVRRGDLGPALPMPTLTPNPRRGNPKRRITEKLCMLVGPHSLCRPSMGPALSSQVTCTPVLCRLGPGCRCFHMMFPPAQMVQEARWYTAGPKELKA